MRKNTKTYIILAIIYFVLVFAPYFVPALNSATPHILGLPFTVFYVVLVMALGCAILFWAANNVWDSFDKNMDDKNTASAGDTVEK